MTEGLGGFHVCPPPSGLLREEMPPTFLTERRPMGDDVVMLMGESPGSFLPMLNAPGRTRMASLAEVTACLWILGDEYDLFSSEEFGRELDTIGDGFSATSVAFIGVVTALVAG